MPQDESAKGNLHFDYLTGIPTSIDGPDVSWSQRATCAALNRQRAGGIIEVREEAQRRQPISAHVWRDALARRLEEWEVPLVSLERMGVRIDSDGFFESDFLVQLKAGAEATPFADYKRGVVYKLFDLRTNGSLGKKLELIKLADGSGFNLINSEADVIHTVQKLAALSEAGAHPTEIVGYSDGGDFLIAKQPLAGAYKDFHPDLKIACDHVHAIFPGRANLGRGRCAVFYALARPWLLADLHEGNIMRNSGGKPTIIDALIGSIAPVVRRQLSWLDEACRDAQSFRETGDKPIRDLFDGISDDEL